MSGRQAHDLLLAVAGCVQRIEHRDVRRVRSRSMQFVHFTEANARTAILSAYEQTNQLMVH